MVVPKESSGNIFIDLGFPPDEAEILQMRADLMNDLRNYIKANKLTKVKAAQLLGVSQSRISDLVQRKRDRFSLEMLITLAIRAGMPAYTTRLSSKGQITIPKEIRLRQHWVPGQEFQVIDIGDLIMLIPIRLGDWLTDAKPTGGKLKDEMRDPWES